MSGSGPAGVTEGNARRGVLGEFVEGLKAPLPLMVGVVPFGLIYGALAVRLGVPASIAQAMSSVIFAGSAQFIALPLIASVAPGFVIVLTVWVVNLRHALYSASVAPHVRSLPRSWKMLLAYFLVDETYAVVIAHYHEGGDARHKHWFFLGLGLMLWLTWQVSTAIGILIGAQVPAGWSLDFAMPLTFIALVMPMVKTRAHGLAALAAGAMSVLAFALPYKLGLMLAAAVGIGVGMLVAGRGR